MYGEDYEWSRHSRRRWARPVIVRMDDGTTVIEGGENVPDAFIGCKVVDRVWGAVCGVHKHTPPSPVEDDVICGLQFMHSGPHWECSKELVEQMGPLVVLRKGSGTHVG